MIAVVILLRVNCFSENIVVAETSYQKLEVLSFCNRERRQWDRENVRNCLL